MPRGSEVCRQLSRIGRRSRQCAYHNPNLPLASFFWPDTSQSIRDMSCREMPQSSLDPIAGNRIPHRSATTNPTRGPSSSCSSRCPLRCTAWTTSVGRLTRTPRLVVRRNSLELRILSDRGSTVVDRGDSGGQSGAALAAPGRHDGAAGAGPHPQTETMGTTATSIARLERALAHGKTPKPSEWSQFRYGAHTARIAGGASRWQRPLWKRPSNGTGHRQTGQTDANPANASLAGCDLGGLKGCQMRALIIALR